MTTKHTTLQSKHEMHGCTEYLNILIH